jgi:hypothetical protein
MTQVITRRDSNQIAWVILGKHGWVNCAERRRVRWIAKGDAVSQRQFIHAI